MRYYTAKSLGLHNSIYAVTSGGAVRRRGRGFQNTGIPCGVWVITRQNNWLTAYTGGNDSTVTAEPTYDRVESTQTKDDTRAARCSS